MEGEEEESFKCEKCPGKLFNNDALFAHFRNVHADADRTCPFCPKSFKSRNYLATHITDYHKNKVGLHEGILKVGQDQNIIYRSKDLIKKLEELGMPEKYELLENETFIVSYDKRIRMARWTFNVLTPLTIANLKTRDALLFSSDTRVSRQLTRPVFSYFNLHAGHLSPAASNTHSTRGHKQSFLYTNTVPMLANVNEGVWQVLEGKARKLAKKWIVSEFSGPIIDKSKPKVEVPGGFEIPVVSAFFKVLLVQRPGEPAQHQCYIVQNKDNSDLLYKHRSNLEEIELRTGLKFLSKVQCVASWDSPVAAKCYPCPVSKCLRVFITEESCKEHEIKHKKPFACTYCSERFKTKIELRVHKQNAHKGTHICNRCGKAFFTPSALKSHKITHLGRRDFVCDICQKEFLTKGHLTRHVKEVHVKKMDFICAKCNNGFVSKDNLRNHESTCGKNPKKKATQQQIAKGLDCKICGIGFNHRGQLNRHMKIHDNIREFKCRGCGRDFVLKGNCKIHEGSCPKVSRKDNKKKQPRKSGLMLL